MYKVFVYDREIIITDQKPEYPVINSLVIDIINEKDFRQKIGMFFKDSKKHKNILHISGKNPDTLLSYLKNYAAFIEAAGGLVTNVLHELLFIYRYGKWDLPKGKKQPGEKPEITAKREVIEECGIDDIKIIEPLTPTYHMYLLSSEQWALKKTYWYLMRSDDWKNPVPQWEEDISKVVWVNQSNLNKYLSNTYPSIKMLVDNYLKNK